MILAILILSLFPGEISGHSPFRIDYAGAAPPGNGHLLGTDFLGRDIFSRTLIGGRISVLIGVTARFGSLFLGLLAGLLSGLSVRGGRFLWNGVIEVFLAIPSLLLAMGLAVVIGEGHATVVIAIVAGTWAPVARFVSAKVEEIRSRDFVTAARALGAGRLRIIFFHIMPELLPVLLPVLSTGIASSIMMESTLTFLGLGGGSSINAVPSWGLVIQEGSKFIFDAPWIIIPPSLLLMVLILCFNQIGDKLVLVISGNKGR
jgi:peptide/nickel transport system permease protein